MLIGGVPATELADRFGTPLYALDAATVRANLLRIYAAFRHPRVAVYYSCKANPSVGLLTRLRSAGARLDACSPGDLAFAAAAGFEPSEISYTGHAMSDHELRRVVEAGVPFTADSLSELERIGKLEPGREVGLRLNCGIAAGFHSHVEASASHSKFGVHFSQLGEALVIARHHGLRVVGLHGHLGSGLTDAGPHLVLLDALLMGASAEPDIAWVNLGGGWSDHGDQSYDFAGFGQEVDGRLAAAEALLLKPLELRLEPGGYLVITAGCLLTRVTEMKPSVRTRGARTPAFVGTDTSHNHLVSAVLYGTDHPIWIADRASDPPDGTYDVVGNLMQGGDVLARGRELPAPRPDDVLVIGHCGGYAAWRAPNFNERPRPAEVIVDEGEAQLLRRAETEADLLRLEAH